MAASPSSSPHSSTAQASPSSSGHDHHSPASPNGKAAVVVVPPDIGVGSRSSGKDDTISASSPQLSSRHTVGDGSYAKGDQKVPIVDGEVTDDSLQENYA